jgi:hypothetical protein
MLWKWNSLASDSFSWRNTFHTSLILPVLIDQAHRTLALKSCQYSLYSPVIRITATYYSYSMSCHDVISSVTVSAMACETYRSIIPLPKLYALYYSLLCLCLGYTSQYRILISVSLLSCNRSEASQNTSFNF